MVVLNKSGRSQDVAQTGSRFRYLKCSADHVGRIGLRSQNVRKAYWPEIAGVQSTKQIAISNLREKPRETLRHMPKSRSQWYAPLFLKTFRLFLIVDGDELPRAGNIDVFRQAFEQSSAAHFVKDHCRRIFVVGDFHP